jgi:hypothetical protein
MPSTQRTFNDRNEITAITEDPGQPAWVTPEYDNNGNMTLCPQPNDLTAGYDLAFDAWNRLVEIHQSAPESSSSSSGTPTLVSTYEYDATGRRTVKYVDADGTYEHFYTGSGGELLETRESTSPSPIPTDFKHQYTWSLASGGPLRRHIDTTSGSSSSSSSAEPAQIFYLTDAAGNTTSIVDDLGTVLERYMYDAYGTVTFLDENCSPRVPNESAYGNAYTYRGWHLDSPMCLYYLFGSYYLSELGVYLVLRALRQSPSNGPSKNAAAAIAPQPICCIKEVNLGERLGPAFRVVQEKTQWFWEAHGEYRFGQVFRVYAEFENNKARGCECRCCSYQQDVKGEFKINGRPQRVDMCNGQQLDTDKFHVDCKEVTLKQGGKLKKYNYTYGDRDLPEVSTTPDTYYVDSNRAKKDRKHGCFYEAKDRPGGLATRLGDKVEIDLTFRGSIIDTCESKRKGKTVVAKDGTLPDWVVKDHDVLDADTKDKLDVDLFGNPR